MLPLESPSPAIPADYRPPLRTALVRAALASALVGAVLAASSPAVLRADTIEAEAGNAANPAFDIVAAEVTRSGGMLHFSIRVVGGAGSTVPEPAGRLEGAPVFAYVWPTSLDSAAAGFEGGAGILALTLTAHPDFDDTPLYDENGDGDPANDGAGWHSHWVVLVPDDACGDGMLKVKDIAPGEERALPETWPDLPILIDSPGFDPGVGVDRVELTIPLADIDATNGFNFDGVTAGLRVSDDLSAPLLCVVDVMDVASGDLSLPGTVE